MGPFACSRQVIMDMRGLLALGLAALCCLAVFYSTTENDVVLEAVGGQFVRHSTSMPKNVATFIEASVSRSAFHRHGDTYALSAKASIELERGGQAWVDYGAAKDSAEAKATPATLKKLAEKCGLIRAAAYEKCGTHFCKAKKACGDPCKLLPFEPPEQIVPTGSKGKPKFYKVSETDVKENKNKEKHDKEAAVKEKARKERQAKELNYKAKLKQERNAKEGVAKERAQKEKVAKATNAAERVEKVEAEKEHEANIQQQILLDCGNAADIVKERCDIEREEKAKAAREKAEAEAAEAAAAAAAAANSTANSTECNASPDTCKCTGADSPYTHVGGSCTKQGHSVDWCYVADDTCDSQTKSQGGNATLGYGFWSADACKAPCTNDAEYSANV